MKKSYVKPELLIENFILSDFIADCTYTGVTFSNAEGSSCSAPTDPTVYGMWLDGVFAEGNCPSVNIDTNPDIFAGSICYHNQNGGIAVFGS